MFPSRRSFLNRPIAVTCYAPTGIEEREASYALFTDNDIFEEHERVQRGTINGSKFSEIVGEHLTPKGNPRAQPLYICTVQNEFLGKLRDVKKTSHAELCAVVEEQAEKWNKQEILERSKMAVEGLHETLQSRLAKIRSILADGLAQSPCLDWDSYTDDTSYPKFTFPDFAAETPPNKPVLPPAPKEPKQNLLEFFIQPLWRRRLDSYRKQRAAWKKEQHEAAERFRADRAAWKERRNTNKRRYNLERKEAEREFCEKRDQFIQNKARRNESVKHFLRCLQAGNPGAVCQYLEAVFKSRPYPRGFIVSHRVDMDVASSTVIVDLEIPDAADVCAISEVRFTKTTGEIKEVEMKPAEFSDFYDSGVKQAVLRTAHEVFAAIHNNEGS